MRDDVGDERSRERLGVDFDVVAAVRGPAEALRERLGADGLAEDDAGVGELDLDEAAVAVAQVLQHHVQPQLSGPKQQVLAGVLHAQLQAQVVPHQLALSGEQGGEVPGEERLQADLDDAERLERGVEWLEKTQGEWRNR